MNRDLNSAQQKVLLRLVRYPSIAKKSLFALVLTLVFILISAAVIDDIYWHFMSDGMCALAFFMEVLLAAVCIYTFVYSRMKYTSIEYREVKEIAKHYAGSNSVAAEALRENTPEAYCTAFGLDYESAKSRTRIWLVLPIIIALSMNGVNTFQAVSEQKAARESVAATQQAIIEAFGDEYDIDQQESPYDKSGYYTYELAMCKKGSTNKVADFTVNRHGKISYLDYEYEFDTDLTTDDNILAAMEWFEEIETIIPGLKDSFDEPKISEFKYDMSDKFVGDIYSSIRKGSNETVRVESNKGHFNVYETCFFYRNPEIRVNVYYYY